MTHHIHSKGLFILILQTFWNLTFGARRNVEDGWVGLSLVLPLRRRWGHDRPKKMDTISRRQGTWSAAPDHHKTKQAASSTEWVCIVSVSLLAFYLEASGWPGVPQPLLRFVFGRFCCTETPKMSGFSCNPSSLQKRRPALSARGSPVQHHLSDAWCSVPRFAEIKVTAVC